MTKKIKAKRPKEQRETIGNAIAKDQAVFDQSIAKLSDQQFGLLVALIKIETLKRVANGGLTTECKTSQILDAFPHEEEHP